MNLDNPSHPGRLGSDEPFAVAANVRLVLARRVRLAFVRRGLTVSSILVDDSRPNANPRTFYGSTRGIRIDCIAE
jgi:hypothetical protein